MRLDRLQANGVHGYLKFDIKFHDDLTFLVGLNGSGKTTALRLAMGLTTPSLETLSEIEFTDCKITIQSDTEITIFAIRTGDTIQIGISGEQETFSFTKLDTNQASSARARHEYLSRLQLESRTTSSIIMRISRLAKPMFLGLDRRFANQERLQIERGFDEAITLFDIRQQSSPPRQSRRDLGASLQEVQTLVRDTMAELRTRQEEVDGELRRRIILDAFTYLPKNSGMIFQPPPPDAIASFKQKRAAIEQAVGSLGVDQSEIEVRLTKYFNQMEQLINGFSSTEAGSKGSRRHRSPSTELVMEWIVNKPQVDRINTLFRMIEEHTVMRAEISSPIDNFITLINRFLSQTNKKIILSSQDYLAVQFGSGEPRQLSALSSGERQIVVMLAHLSLNKNSSADGVFIVDEPELSLHIAWQEMFVDAIRQANPKVQIILATHSPAIILDRDNKCVFVGGDKN